MKNQVTVIGHRAIELEEPWRRVTDRVWVGEASEVDVSKLSGVAADVVLRTPMEPIGLVVFDMDSTLIEQEVIEVLARRCGVEEAVRGITERAMNGELDFEQSLRERVALLRGVRLGPHEVAEICTRELTFTAGARALCARLRELRVRTAVVSGGFEPFARYVREELGLDHHAANVLESGADGRLTGRLAPGAPVVDAQFKAQELVRLARRHGVDAARTCMVGDGANDLAAMRAAGFAVAWHAKPAVQRHADACLNGPSLADLLHLTPT